MNFRQRYQFDVKKDLIGKGGFSKVFRAWDTVRKREVALKFFYGDWSEKYDVIGEINRMEDLVHPNLIRYYDATYISSKSALGEEEKIQVGILEYANYGDISKLFRTDNLIIIRKVITQLLEGLSFLHNNKIVHRDLKPKNILLSNINNEIVVKIADFGISKKVGIGGDEGNSTQLLGSIEYMAPEQFNAKKYGINGQLDTNVDLWSVGIIIYELFTRSTPFGNRSTGFTNEEILNNILFNPIEINYGKLQEPYRTMVKACLEKNATERVQTAEDLLKILHKRIPNNTSTSEKRNNNTKQNFETQVLPNPKELVEKVEKLNSERVELAPLKPIVVSKTDTLTKRETKSQAQPKVTPKKSKYNYNSYGNGDLEIGKNYFKNKDYINSYARLKQYINNNGLDTEAKFFVGYMLYNGKCGGDHNPKLGKQLMDEAKAEDRSLVMDLMVKYVLG